MATRCTSRITRYAPRILPKLQVCLVATAKEVTVNGEMWRTIQDAIQSTGKAVRLCMILVVIGGTIAAIRYL